MRDASEVEQGARVPQSEQPRSSDRERRRRRISRRGFVRWAGRLGGAAVAGAAGVMVTDSPAKAYTIYCCHLARSPGGCPGSGAGYTCPVSTYKRYWTCRYGSATYGCGECVSRREANCWGLVDGQPVNINFICSEYWRIS